MLQITGLKKSFHSNEVLKGIDLEVKQGQVVGMIGSSGSGKSTLLRCLNFLETADSGRYTFDQSTFDVAGVKKPEILEVRRNTAMVFQQFNLFKYKTALENVMEGLVTVQKMPKAQARERSEHYLEKVGLSDRMDYYPAQLSGGQQQRVAIARSIALHPKVILFDEPTSALDPEMITEVLQVIRDVAREGNTMVIVSHEMRFVYDISDHVVFLDEGVILEQGTARDIFLDPQKERTRQFISRANLSGDYVI